ncbi:extracellular solute-binding protein [Roseiarcaceae bacterium H3SJ34-1]|uniref:ABC transporter substrate-binding protein n=1 Tax=Terripilifer ovatus TaxID=3032367 RepID=UPI003AB99A5E|nr:extracellular solute-binding protein [Roseiarcaceae bacterium H3SJ34-1]
MTDIRTLALALSAVCLLGHGARAADQALIDAAKKEGQVVWYTTLIINQLGGPLAEAFEKKYGIKVFATRNDPSEIALRLLNESRAGKVQADVFDGSFAPTALVQAGAVERWQPDVVKQFPKDLYDQNGYWTAHRLMVLTVGYNTNLVPPGTEPKSWNDLLDPKWKGRMAWSSNISSSGGAGFGGLAMIELGDEKGLGFLRALAKQDIVGLKTSARAVLDQVIAGEYAIGLQIFNDNVVISRRVGAPIAWSPINPALAALSVISATSHSPHPNAGKLLVDFVVSEEGQIIARDRDYIPVHPAVAPRDPDVRPDGQRFRAVVMSPEAVDAALPKWRTTFDELFR